MTDLLSNQLSSPQIDAIWNSLDVYGAEKVATSTPNEGTEGTRPPRRKSRRSWFEKSSTKYEIAVEKKAPSKSRKKSDVDEEILMLTHFTNPPKISFGKAKPGVHKTRTLIIRNPHEYAQSVKVEKFPHKKKFYVEHLEFTVDAKGTFLFEISWTPEEEGNVREMILFVVDDTYRLQGFVFGSVEASPKKKIAKRKGLLATKVQRPFSVLHTQSLANIKKSYSPQKGEKRRSSGKTKPHSDVENEPPANIIIPVQEPVDKENDPKDERRKSHRRSNTYIKMHDLDMSPIGLPPGTGKKTNSDDILHSTVRSDNEVNVSPLEAKENLENLLPQTPGNQKFGNVPTETQGFVSPNSFLHESLCKKNETLNNQPGVDECKENKDSLKMMDLKQKKFLSPETFLKDLNTTLDHNVKDICPMTSVPSPDTVLNKSIPHDIVVKQLDTVKTALQKQKPVLNEKNRSSNITSRQIVESEQPVKNNIRRETYTKKSTGRRQSTVSQTSRYMGRRETFVKQEKQANVFVEVPNSCRSSPRRTTFTVKQPHNNKPDTVNFSRSTKSRESTQNDHLHFEKDVVTTETVIQNDVQTVSTIKYTEVIDTYTCTTVDDENNVPTPERSLAMTQQHTTTSTKTEISQTVDSSTVTKNRTLPTPERSYCGKQLFSPHTGQTVHSSSFNSCENSSFGSPRRLPDSPLAAVVTRRVSTTVTKQRPSDALIEHAQRRLSTCLFEQEEEEDDDMEDDSLEDKPFEKNDISIIEEEVVAENGFTPLVNRTESKQRFMEGELDTPMREAGFTQLKVQPKNKFDVDETNNHTQYEQVMKSNANTTLEGKDHLRSLKNCSTIVHNEIDTALKCKISGKKNETENGHCKPIVFKSENDLEEATEISKPLKNVKAGDETSIEINQRNEHCKPIRFQCENDMDTPMKSVNSEEKFDESEQHIIKDDIPDLPFKTSIKTNLDYDAECKNELLSKQKNYANQNLDTPLRLIADNEDNLNLESTENFNMKRRSIWEKPCDLSVTFDNLDTPLREAHFVQDVMDISRRQSRRSFWEKLDESKSTPVLLKGMNNSGNTSEPSGVDSPAEVPQTSSHVQECNADKNASFPSTPHHLLPKNPNPDNSRRSTHIVEKPKVLNLDDAQRKKLFSDEKQKIEDAEKMSLNGNFNVNIADVTKSFIVQVENESDHSKTNNAVIEKCQTYVPIKNNNDHVICNVQKNTEKSNGFTKIKEKQTIKVEENTCAASSGLFFISCSHAKPIGHTVETYPSTRQPNKPEVTSVKKTSPKRPLSQARMSERKRQKTVPVKISAEDGTKPQSGFSVKENLGDNKKTQTSRTNKPLSRQTANKGSTAVQGRVTAPAKGVAQAKLLLIKKTKTVLPKHPLPFASKNMYYDERWMEKQERGFVHWLNFVLTPADEYQQTKKVKVDAGSLCVDNGRNNVKLAPTREVLSFRAYGEHKRLNQLRRAACRLFQTQEVVHVVQKVEVEVESGRLFIRKDRKVHADLGLKQAILDMLLSFNPLWLRIGLETTFGEMIMLQNNGDVIGLSRFIVTRLLSNPDIANEFSHPSVPHLYKDGYAEAISRHLLKKFLILVYFLDHAKSNRLVPQDPCLFCKDVEFKTCKTMLVEFSRDYLAGEGDITRHLGYLGYQIKHTQTAMDEFDYAVTNLATDLKDGIRLARVMEILSNDHSWTKRMRAPAISRLQKIHNMDLVFQILAKQGIQVDQKGCQVTSRDIVDGHREKTLKFLWTLIVQYQVSLLLNKEQLKDEIRILERSLKVKNQLSALQRFEQIISQRKRESVDPDLFSQNEVVQLLLKWCRVVCAFYQIKVENFTVSFGDGRVLCHLIHHYHPSLLPREIIHLQTMMTLSDNTESNQSQDNSLSGSFDQPPFAAVQEDCELFEQLLANEKENFRVLYEKVSELGGIPLMLRSADMSNTIPDEKVVVTYVSYLCARLLDIRQESRAARVIQLAWRRHHLKKIQQDYLVKQKAVVVLQRAVKGFLQKRRHKRWEKAVVKIQTVWRVHRAKKMLIQLKWKRDNEKKIQAASIIKRYLLACRDRRSYLRKIKSIIRIQAAIRSYIVQQKYNRIINSVRLIQSKYRAYKLGKMSRLEYLKKKMAAIKIQSFIRMFNAKKCCIREKAAVMIQTKWRMYVCQKLFKKCKLSAVQIQAWYRMKRSRKNFGQLKTATLTLQRHFSAYLLMKKERQKYQKVKGSCVKLQKWWRSAIQMKRLKQNMAALKIQKSFKGYVARKQYIATKNCTIKVQAMVRTCLAQRQYRKQKAAAIIIQTWYRRHLMVVSCQEQFRQQRSNIILAQACVRRWKCMKDYKRLRQATIRIQSHIKTLVAVNHFQQMKKAVAVIQKFYRAKVAMIKDKKAYENLKMASLTIQSYWRGSRVRQNVRKMHKAATVIQTRFKGQIARDYYLCLRELVIKCQQVWRAKLQKRLERKEFLQKERAVVLIQSTFRCHLDRKRYQRILFCSTKIQSRVRGYQQRKRFEKTKNAVLLCQRHYRALVQGRNIRTHYNLMRGAAITIQAFYRGFRVRKMFRKLNSAAVAIQSTFRMMSTRKKFLLIKKNVESCQRLYRAKIKGQKVRSDYLNMRNAAIIIQCNFRCFKVQKELKKQNDAATKIQSVFKGYKGKNNYQKLKTAVSKCQEMYRSKVIGQKKRQEYLLKKVAALTIQKSFRIYKIKQEVKRTNNAAQKIQAYFRGYRQRKAFLKLKEAVVKCQNLYRHKIVGKLCRQRYLISKGAIITIQAGYKGWKTRLEVKRFHKAAVLIQSAFRGYIHRRRFTSIKQAVISCQRVYRAYRQGSLVRREFLIQKGAALTIEDWYCSCMVRRKEKKRQKAAIVIQSWYKGYKVKNAYQKKLLAVTTIQKHIRSFLSMKQCRNRYSSMRKAAIVIQKFVRGYHARRKYLQDVRSIVTIQSAVKSYLQRKQFVRLKSAVTCCQRRFRAKLEGQRQRKIFENVKSSVIVLQSHFRMLNTQRKYKTTLSAVVTIQKQIRQYLAHKHFRTIKKAANVIQQIWQATLLMRDTQRMYLIKKGAAITIQAWWKGKLTQQKYRRAYLSVVALQAIVRGTQQHKKYLLMRSSACIIQNRFRAYLLGKKARMKFIKMKKSAVKLQALVRAYHARTQYRKLKACVIIQSHYRSHICRKKYHQIRSAIIKIQSGCRGMIGRKLLKKKMEAITKLQKYMKKKLFVNRMNKYLQVRRNSAIQIQAGFRGYQARKIVKTVKAATKIQAGFRGYMARRMVIKIKAAIKIQSVIRMNIQRKRFLCDLRNIVVVQSCGRRFLAKITVQIMRQQHMEHLVMQRKAREEHLKRFSKVTWVNLAAVLVQRCYRRYRIMQQAKEKMHKVVIIQRWMKSKICRLRYLRFQKALVIVQRKTREYLQKRERAALKIQAAFRIWIYIQKQKKRLQSIVKIQALWRGGQVRRRSIGKKIEQIRKRVELANRSATEEKKLGNRMASALDYLLRYKQLSYILEVLIHLDVATRLSAACCEKFVSVNAVQVIYRLMRGCNRSQPHMELIKYSVSILLNLAKYEKTVYEVYNVEGAVDTLVELMQIYREKGSIFNSTCMLLGILGMIDKCRMEVREDKKTSEKIKSIHLLTARKNKLDETRQLRQARLQAAKSFNCSLPIHPPHKKQHKIKPDWVLRKDKMKEIQDPLTAINFVMDSFQLKPK